MKTIEDRKDLIESVLATTSDISSGFVRCLKIVDEGIKAGLTAEEIEELVRKV